MKQEQKTMSTADYLISLRDMLLKGKQENNGQMPKLLVIEEPGNYELERRLQSWTYYEGYTRRAYDNGLWFFWRND